MFLHLFLYLSLQEDLHLKEDLHLHLHLKEDLHLQEDLHLKGDLKMNNIHRLVLEQAKNLNSTTKCLLSNLLTYLHGDKTECYPSIRDISNLTGFSRRTIQKHLRILEQLDYILILEQDGRKSNLYKMICIDNVQNNRRTKHAQRSSPEGELNPHVGHVDLALTLKSNPSAVIDHPKSPVGNDQSKENDPEKKEPSPVTQKERTPAQENRFKSNLYKMLGANNVQNNRCTKHAQRSSPEGELNPHVGHVDLALTLKSNPSAVIDHPKSPVGNDQSKENDPTMAKWLRLIDVTAAREAKEAEEKAKQETSPAPNPSAAIDQSKKHDPTTVNRQREMVDVASKKSKANPKQKVLSKVEPTVQKPRKNNPRPSSDNPKKEYTPKKLVLTGNFRTLDKVIEIWDIFTSNNWVKHCESEFIDFLCTYSAICRKAKLPEQNKKRVRNFYSYLVWIFKQNLSKEIIRRKDEEKAMSIKQMLFDRGIYPAF